MNEGGGEEEDEEGDDVPNTLQYDPRTIASDLLRVLGEHPTLPPLNAHLQGRQHFPAPLADPSFGPRSRNLPTEATGITHGQSNQQTPGRSELEKVNAEQEATAAEGRARREKAVAERNARVIAEDHIISTTPPRPSQNPLDRDPRGNNNLGQTHQALQLGVGWEMHRIDAGYVYFVNRRTGAMTFEDPRVSAQPLQFSRLGHLPSGWQLCVIGPLNDPRLYYKDNNTNTKTWRDPRPPPS